MMHKKNDIDAAHNKVWIVSLLLLVTAACSSGGGNGIAPALLDADLSDLHPYVAESSYSDVISRCAQISSSRASCKLSQLPFLGQKRSNPTVDDVMERVVVSHDWMGERFREVLEQLPPDILTLMRSVTFIAIDADIRPAYYWAGTGGIYLDPRFLWLSTAEFATIPEIDDYRSDFGSDLIFSSRWRYTKDNDYAFPAYDTTGVTARALEVVIPRMAYLLYHELAHANDFLPSSEISNLDVTKTAYSALISIREVWVSEVLYKDMPLQDTMLPKMARVRWRGDKATAEQKQTSASDMGNAHALDGANNFYSYYTSREDVAMLFEAAMLKHHYGFEMDVGYTGVPADEENARCDDYVVAWGQRNRIADPLVDGRAQLVVTSMLPSFDWNSFDIGSKSDMSPNIGWCDNLDLRAGREMNAFQRLTIEKSESWDFRNHENDLNGIK